MTEQLGRIPKEGERPQVQMLGLKITVLEVEDNRISRLLIVKEPLTSDGEAQEEKSR